MGGTGAPDATEEEGADRMMVFLFGPLQDKNQQAPPLPRLLGGGGEEHRPWCAMNGKTGRHAGDNNLSFFFFSFFCIQLKIFLQQ